MDEWESIFSQPLIPAYSLNQNHLGNRPMYFEISPEMNLMWIKVGELLFILFSLALRVLGDFEQCYKRKHNLRFASCFLMCKVYFSRFVSFNPNVMGLCIAVLWYGFFFHSLYGEGHRGAIVLGSHSQSVAEPAFIPSPMIPGALPFPTTTPATPSLGRHCCYLCGRCYSW